MGNREIVARECDRANMVRRVCMASVDDRTFFHEISGPLMISGLPAGEITLVGDLICEYAARNDMPTVVLTGRPEILGYLQELREEGSLPGTMISSPASRNYHPMYGLSRKQILQLFRRAGEEAGYGARFDDILPYAEAAITAAASRYPASLPAIHALLEHDDDFIVSLAIRMGLPGVTANSVAGNYQAGVMFRRIIELLEETLEGIAVSDSETKYNLQSGSMGNLSVMAVYQISNHQSLMNAYLREEIFSTLKRVPKLRVILNEVAFCDDSDELLVELFRWKRQGRVELIAVSENVKEMLWDTSLNFGNICLFLHENPEVTETLSREIFGTYPYHYPTLAVGHPPVLLFSFRREEHWAIATEERLRIRCEDLYETQRMLCRTGEKMAIKIMGKSMIYTVPVRKFLPEACGNQYPAAVRSGY